LLAHTHARARARASVSRQSYITSFQAASAATARARASDESAWKFASLERAQTIRAASLRASGVSEALVVRITGRAALPDRAALSAAALPPPGGMTVSIGAFVPAPCLEDPNSLEVRTAVRLANRAADCDRVANPQHYERVATVVVRPTLPLTPLSVKDLHLEYVFSHQASEVALLRVEEMDAAGGKEPKPADAEPDRPVAASYVSAGNAAAAAAARSPAEAQQPRAAAAAESAAGPAPLARVEPASSQKRARQDGDAAAAAPTPASGAAASAAPQLDAEMDDADAPQPHAQTKRPRLADALPPAGPAATAAAAAPLSHMAAFFGAGASTSAGFVPRGVSGPAAAPLSQASALFGASASTSAGFAPRGASRPASAVAAAGAAFSGGLAAPIATLAAPQLLQGAASSPAAASDALPAGMPRRSPRKSAYNIYTDLHQRALYDSAAASYERMRAGGASLSSIQRMTLAAAKQECSLAFRQLSGTERARYQRLADEANMVMQWTESNQGGSFMPIDAAPAAAAAAAAPAAAPLTDTLRVRAAVRAASTNILHPLARTNQHMADAAIAALAEDADMSDADAPAVASAAGPASAAAAACAPALASLVPRPAEYTAAVAAGEAAAAAAPTSAPANTAERSVMGIMQEHTCSICCDTIYQTVVLDCAHSFCRDCIEGWFRTKKSCPMCRVVHKGAPRPVRSSDNTINILIKNFATDDEKKDRLARIARIDQEQADREAKVDARIKARIALSEQQRAGAGSPGAAASARSMVQRAGAHVPLPPLDERDELDVDEDEGEDEGEGEEDPDDEEDNEGGLVGELARRRAETIAAQRAIAAAAAAAIPRPPTHTLHVDVAPTRCSACQICFSLIDTGLLRLRHQPVAQAAAAAPRPAHYHLVCFAMNRRLDRAVLLGMDSLPPNERVLADGILDTA
jgi:hypothetical protein